MTRLRQARGELDEHADAVAGRAAAERVAAILVEQRGTEHVDMRPGSFAGKLRQERRGHTIEETAVVMIGKFWPPFGPVSPSPRSLSVGSQLGTPS